MKSFLSSNKDNLYSEIKDKKKPPAKKWWLFLT